MRWANPEFAALLWLVPVLLGAAWLAERHRAAVERSLGDPASLRERAHAPGSGLRWTRHALILAAAALAIAGIARPQAGFRLVTTTSRGVDLVVALDLSHSMEARDVCGPRSGSFSRSFQRSRARRSAWWNSPGTRAS